MNKPRICACNKERTRFQVKLGSKSLGYFSSEIEAIKFRDSATQVLPEVMQQSEIASDPSNTIFGLARLCFAEMEQQGFRSYTRSKEAYHRYVENQSIALVPLDKLTRGHVQSWLNWMETLWKNGKPHLGKLAPQTIKNTRNALAAIVRYAVKRGLMAENITNNLVYARSKRNKKGNALYPWEAFLLLSHPDIPIGHRMLYQFALFSGMRAGELSSLHWSDVDLQRNTIYIRFGGIDDKGKLTPTKTGEQRTIPLLPLAKSALQWAKARSVQNASGLIWVGASGKAIRSDRSRSPQLNKHLTLIDAKGCFKDRKLTFHSLRHTAASFLLCGILGDKWSLQEVRDMLGHLSVSTTEIYTHMLTSLATEAAGRLKAA